MNESHSVWRSLAIGALLGLLGVAGIAAWLAQEARTAAEPPGDMLVIALTRSVDDAVVAGIVYATEGSGDARDVRFIDPDAEVTIPGTSYDTLKDSYSFGGGQAVLDAVATLDSEARGGSPAPDAWVVLQDDSWKKLVDDGGGASVDVPVDINAFVEGRLFMFASGRQRVDGEELYALASSVGFLEDSTDAAELQQEVGEAVARIVEESWSDVASVVSAGDGASSVSPRALESFGEDADNR